MTGWWAVAFAVQWVLLVVLCVVVIALARQVGTLHLRLGPRGALEIDDEGPPLGEAPPVIAAVDPDGETLILGGPGRPRLVLFASETCSVCREVAPGVPAAASSGRLQPLVVHEHGVVVAKGTVNTLEQVEGLVDTASQRLSEERHRWAS